MGRFSNILGFCFHFRTVFGLFFVMNLILWSKGSSGAVPFSTLVALLALWFCVSVPLTFIGAYFGFRKRVSVGIMALAKFLIISDHSLTVQ